jgi:carbamoyl-phosphate synthase large subunit
MDLIEVSRKMTMSNYEVCVMIAGAGGGGHGMELIKAFKIASHRYKIVATDMWANSFGLSETPHHYVIQPASSPSYIDSLLKICKKENVQAIATGSEPELKQVSKNATIFEENGIKVLLNPWKVIEICTDKYAVMNYLSSKGIQTPYQFLYENESDINKIESYPVVIKPKIGGGSQNVFLAQDREEATFFARYLKKYGYEPLIQEYVGNHEEEFTIGVLYADNGRLLNSIAMKRILGSGLSTRQTIVDPKTKRKYVISSGISQGLIDDFKDIRKTAEKIAQVLGVNGPVNIQCRKTESGIVPFEVNPRFSGTTGPRSLVGCNEPDIFCRYRLFDEIPNNVEYKFGYVVRGLVEKYIPLGDAHNITKI